MNSFSTMPLNFRAWDTSKEEFIYFDLLNCEFLNSLVMDPDRFVISQDTGLKDKNGESIYTGDIVQFEDACVAICYWDNSAAEVEFQVVRGSDNVKGFIEQYKIIGNIWQNPELLEKNND